MSSNFTGNSSDLSPNTANYNGINSTIGSNSGLQISTDYSNALNINNYFRGSSSYPAIEDVNLRTESFVDSVSFNPPLTSGWYTVGNTGKVSFDYLFDGGAYVGELAIFSLEGMGQYELGSNDFIQEAVRRALSNSTLGHVVISDSSEAARFSGTLKWDANYNLGEYRGIKNFAMRPGDQFGIMQVPNGRVQEVFNNPGIEIEGDKHPLFSLAPTNPLAASHFAQFRDVNNSGRIFAMEDLREDGTSDNDFNDFVFYMEGAVGDAPSVDSVINFARDWRESDVAKQIMEWEQTPLDNQDKPITPPDKPIAPPDKPIAPPDKPIAPPSYKDGDLVKGSDEKVYFIEAGKKRWISNPGIFQEMGFKKDAIKTLSDTDLNNIYSSDNLSIPTKYQELVNITNEWRSDFYWWDGNGTPFLDFSSNSNNKFATLNLGSNTGTGGKKGINFNWGAGSPKGDDKLLNDDFVVRSYTQANFEKGKKYKARVKADDGYQLFAKNQSTGQWVYFTPQNEWKMDAYGSAKEIEFQVPQTGLYDFHVQYFEGGGNAYFDITWEDSSLSEPAPNIFIKSVSNDSNSTRSFVLGKSVKVQGNSNTGNLEFYVGDRKVDATLDYQSNGEFSAKFNIPSNIAVGEYKVKVIAKNTTGENTATSSSVEIINGGNNYREVQSEGDTFDVKLYAKDGKDYEPTDKNIWIIVHGWNNNASNWEDLAEAVEKYPTDDLVLLLDWGGENQDGKRGAQTGFGTGLAYNTLDALNKARRRIDLVADKAVETIRDKLGNYAKSSLNFIGHSLGTYVSGEIAQRLGGVDKLILFDPASNALSDYNDDVKFSDVSNISKAFYSSLLGDYARDADESYIVKQNGKNIVDDTFTNLINGNVSKVQKEFEDSHIFPKKLYSQILQSQDNFISQLFGLEDRELDKDLVKDTFNQEGNTESGLGKDKFFEGVILADANGSPIELRYETSKDSWIVRKSEKNRLRTLNFALEDQSLWGLGQVPNPNINIYGKPSAERNVGVGKVSAGLEYKLEAFLSSGTFDVNLPVEFEISYSDSVQANSSTVIKFKPRLTSKGSLETQLGGSLIGAANLFAKFESTTSWIPSYEMKPLGGKFDANEQFLKEKVKSPVVFDIGLNANINEIKDNKLTAEDKALQYIDVVNALAFAASIAASSTGFGASLLPFIQAAKDGIDAAGIGAKLGANIKQESILEVKEFEIDIDNEKNGNEINVSLDNWGELRVPIPSYQKGDTYKFSPTIRPIVDFETKFSIAGTAEATFDLKKALKFIPELFNETEFKLSGETPYTQPISFTDKFDPFKIVNYYTNLSEISFGVT